MSLHMKVVVGPLANVAMIRITDQVSRILPMCMTVFGKSIIVYARKSSIENEDTNGNKEIEAYLTRR